MRLLILAFLTGTLWLAQALAENGCAAPLPLNARSISGGWNGWGAGTSNSRFQTARAAALTATDVPRLKLKWAFGFQGVRSVLSQPTVVVKNKGLLTVGIMAAVIMQVLDTTIANVALPHMRSSLGASQDEINWVLTSYIVASAIATPLTGWFADRFGCESAHAFGQKIRAHHHSLFQCPF